MKKALPKAELLCRKSHWETFVGLEIHAQIACSSKLFSGSLTDFSGRPNANVALLDSSIPGTLPVLNRRCVEAGILTALALDFQINLVSRFDRKHYFYPDLPSGYQITQQRYPLAKDGQLDFWVFDQKRRPKAYRKRTRLLQLQLEQDSGKSFHDSQNLTTLVDLNRAGVSLMELVTEPNMCDGFEAASFVRELALVLSTIGTCGAEMQKGQLRVDANVSIRRKGEQDPTDLGVRTEVKNISSYNFVRIAVEYEILRQIQAKESGEEILNETRSFDFRTGRTVAMRDKEQKGDYRYLAEPNLPPLRLSEDDADGGLVSVAVCRRRLPSLPSQERDDWIRVGVPPGDALFIKRNPVVADYFRQCLRLIGQSLIPVMTEWLMYELRLQLKQRKLTLAQSPMSPAAFIDLIHLVRNEDQITKEMGQQVLIRILDGELKLPKEMVESENLWRSVDWDQIEAICSREMEDSPALVSKCRHQESRPLNTLVEATSTRSEFRISAVDARCCIVRKLSLPSKP